jgi:hypothetical protein
MSSSSDGLPPSQSSGYSTPLIDVPDRNLVVDEFTERLAAFKQLSKDDVEGASALLEHFGAKGKVEADIVKEMAAIRPLYLSGRFEEAHRIAMRALEVLDRNGARSPKLPPMGPLAPIASFMVQLVARFIVRNHQAEVIKAIKHIYIRRESQCAPTSPERFIVRRARIDAERVQPTLRSNPIGVPAFLLGGAFLSSIVSAIGRGLTNAGSSRIGVLIAAVVLSVVIAAASWTVVRGAAIARSRIRLSLDKPLNGLWETIGAAGKPPKDQARAFALIATILPVLSTLVLLIGIIVAVVRY